MKKSIAVYKYHIELIAILIHFSVYTMSFVSCKSQPVKASKYQEISFNNHPHSFISEYPITAKGKPTIAYQNIMRTVQRLGLDSLQQGYDSLQIRLWTGHALNKDNHTLILKMKPSVYEAELITFTEGEDSIKTSRTANLKPNSGWNYLISNILQQDILTLPSMDNIPGFDISWADGALYGIEVATRNQYRFYYYWCPEIIGVRFQQAVHIQKILELVDREFGIKIYYPCD